MPPFLLAYARAYPVAYTKFEVPPLVVVTLPHLCLMRHGEPHTGSIGWPAGGGSRSCLL